MDPRFWGAVAPITVEDLPWLGQLHAATFRVLTAAQEKTVLRARDAEPGANPEVKDWAETVARAALATLAWDGEEIHFSDNPREDDRQRLAYAEEWPEPLVTQLGLGYMVAKARLVEARQAVAADPNSAAGPGASGDASGTPATSPGAP